MTLGFTQIGDIAVQILFGMELPYNYNELQNLMGGL